MRLLMAGFLMVTAATGYAAGNSMIIENGNDLYVKCTALRGVMAGTPTGEKDRVILAVGCLNYLDGFRNGHLFSAAFAARRTTKGAITESDIQKEEVFCTPANMTTGEIADLTVSFLDKFPEKRNAPAGLVLITALRDAYPCSK